MGPIAITIGHIVSWLSKAFGFGAGATWSGEIALRLNPHIIPKLLPRIKRGIIVVAGTNGKTTTSLMIKKILEDQGFSVLHNASGANLLNGIVSALIQESQADWGVFEVDENSLPVVLKYLKPKILVLLNLFRDQLDRYGEVDVIAEKWGKALRDLDPSTTVIANADDPHLTFIGKNIAASVSYFGLDDKTYYLPAMQHATDTLYCPSCGKKLAFQGVYFSHLGDWKCTACGLSKPKLQLSSKDVQSPLEGIYNIYNTLAATLVGKTVGIPKNHVEESLTNFVPAFGRMEQIQYHRKSIIILLSKNPTGFNESLRTMLVSKEKGPLMLVLNDRIPDGTDVSWIWDVDFEQLDDYRYPIIISGDRYLDLALRMKYAVSKFSIYPDSPAGRNFQFSIKSQVRNDKNIHRNTKVIIEENLEEAVRQLTGKIKEGETGWILATYSAMLDVRKILTGKKIL